MIDDTKNFQFKKRNRVNQTSDSSLMKKEYEQVKIKRDMDSQYGDLLSHAYAHYRDPYFDFMHLLTACVTFGCYS